MSHQAEPPPRQVHWGWVASLVLLVLVLGGLTFAYTRAEPTLGTVTSVATVNADTAALTAETERNESCQVLNAQWRRLVERYVHNFHLHHQAHLDMVDGKISKTERNRIWTVTLANEGTLRPLILTAMKASTKEGCA